MENEEQDDQQERERGGCLTAFLSVTIFLEALSIISGLLNGTLSKQLIKLAKDSGTKVPSYPSWYTPVTIIMAIITIVCLAAILKWKKWGAFGYLIMTLIGIAMTIAFSKLTAASIITTILLSLIWPAILAILLKPVWKHME